MSMRDEVLEWISYAQVKYGQDGIDVAEQAADAILALFNNPDNGVSS